MQIGRAKTSSVSWAIGSAILSSMAVLVFCADMARADPAGIAGPDWTLKTEAGNDLYKSPQEDEVMYFKGLSFLKPEAALKTMKGMLRGQGCKTDLGTERAGAVEVYRCEGMDPDGINLSVSVYSGKNPAAKGTLIIAHSVAKADSAALSRQSAAKAQILSYFGAPASPQPTTAQPQAENQPAPARPSPIVTAPPPAPPSAPITAPPSPPAASKPVAHAGRYRSPADLKPSGWSMKKKRYGEAYEYLPPSGAGEGLLGYYPNRSLEEASLSVTKFMRPTSHEEIKVSAPQTLPSGGLMTLGYYKDRYEGTTQVFTGLAIPHALSGIMVCHFGGPARAGQIPPGTAQFIEACEQAALQGMPTSEEMAQRGADIAAITARGIPSGAGHAVETVLLHLYYVTGANAAVFPDYKPVVLFKNGFACKCLGEGPASQINLSEQAKTNPSDVTTWTLSGGKYLMKWPGSSSMTEIPTERGRAMAFPAGHRLNGAWGRISSSGASPDIGGVSVHASNGYRFFSDGRFSNSRAVIGDAGNVGAAGSGSENGRYEIGAGGELTLRYNNGTVKRASLYNGGERNGRTVLWLGGRSYTQ